VTVVAAPVGEPQERQRHLGSAGERPHGDVSSPALVPGFAGAHVPSDLWWIGWDGKRHKSPPWLGLDHLEPLAEARAGGIDGFPRLFARKFSSATSGAVLDAIDRELRAAVATR